MAAMKAAKTTEKRAETAAQKAAETGGKMGLEDAENIANTATNDILQRLWQSFERSSKCRQCEMPKLEFKTFDAHFHLDQKFKKNVDGKLRSFRRKIAEDV